MEGRLYEPLEFYEKQAKAEHDKNVTEYFNELLAKSQIDEAANKATVAKYHQQMTRVEHFSRKLRGFKVLRVFMIIFTVIAFIAFLVRSVDETSFIGPIGAVCALITRFTASMFQGIVQNSLDFLHAEVYGKFTFYIFEAVMFFVFSLISVLVIHFGYMMGVKEKRLLAFMKSDKKYE